MLYGIRPEEQKRIADRGNQMRVYIPYGEEWYGYLMRRMAERPANTLFFLRGGHPRLNHRDPRGTLARSRSSAPASWARRCCPG